MRARDGRAYRAPSTSRRRRVSSSAGRARGSNQSSNPHVRLSAARLPSSTTTSTGRDRSDAAMARHALDALDSSSVASTTMRSTSGAFDNVAALRGAKDTAWSRYSNAGRSVLALSRSERMSSLTLRTSWTAISPHFVLNASTAHGRALSVMARHHHVEGDGTPTGTTLPSRVFARAYAPG